MLYSANVATIELNNPAAVNAMVGPDTADRDHAFIGLTAQERAVQALYLDALGRPGAKSELDAWAALLPAGATALTPAVVSGIEDSFEARDHLVKSWYVAYLGRQANGTEEQGWVNLLAVGQSEEQVLGGILSSQEFYGRAQTLVSTGTADRRFVQALYQVLLDRTAGNSEVDIWVNVLATQGRLGVALGFLRSAEFRTDQFEGYYNALLHRPGDSALSAWVSSGLDVLSAHIAFESSSEFFSNG
jgi:hypothetical protein